MRRLLIAMLGVTMRLSSAHADTSYHGFSIDQSARQLAPDVMASLNAQLDIVEAVGLPPAVLAALKATPIIVDPDLRGNPGIFAVTGTLYLFGDIQQPPFSCNALAKLDPDYLDFLAAQFGAHACHGGVAN